MDIERLIRYLEDPSQAASWLRAIGLENTERAHANILNMARAGMTLDLLAIACDQFAAALPAISDPDRALNNLDHFVTAARNPIALGALFERDTEALPTLLQIFSTSQYLANCLEGDPEAFDLLRLTEGQPVARQALIEDICTDIATVQDDRVAMMILRRHKRRETLRIAYGDIVRGQHLATVTAQISYLADAMIEAAVQTAWRIQQAKRGTPRLPDGTRARFAVMALGKLGGMELNYSSDIDLIFLSDGKGKTDGPRSISNTEFFDRLAQQIIRILTEPMELGILYRVDLRLRPQGKQGPVVCDLESALRYYNVYGRTWERQALVKTRVVAGDSDLGNFFLKQLQPWIYRRYLCFSEIDEIRALRRRIEHRARREGGDRLNIKLGMGGIRDIEFTIQFLQLLNGGNLKEIRTPSTLKAIASLERSRCLTMQERTILEESYVLLRKIEHRLQIMFDLQTHTLPDDDRELRRLALRTGYVDGDTQSALDGFKHDLQQKMQLNRKILDHLLQAAFPGNLDAALETDLVLDPDPPREVIQECLAKHGFGDISTAYTNLMALTTERVSFLSTHRSRHFLAAIAPSLLKAIAATPDPDSTLVNLSQVSDSLGGKGVLWELFSFDRPTLNLYVQLCATSPYLSGILTSNPGMIDELMDSLIRNKLPTYESLRRTLSDLSHGAEDLEPILHSFKSFQHLRVGVRDILGKDDVQDTHRALSDIAEVCLQEATRYEYGRMIQKYGRPMAVGHDRDDHEAEFVIVALGKLGGREPNYHSDLDVVFLYDAEGQTRHLDGNRSGQTTVNHHFFSRLAQRVIKIITRLGVHGRLYEIDPRLRPTGKSGTLAVSLDEFNRYFSEGRGQLWERQALCKARTITGSAEAQARVMSVIRKTIVDYHWQPNSADEIRRMRMRMQQTASDRNLKRGVGGTVDIEFIVQMLQMKYAVQYPDIVCTGTLAATEMLCRTGKLAEADAAYLTESYRFLRSVESRLRLMNTTARHDLPIEDQPMELKKLAFLIGYDSSERLLADCRRYQRKNRECFNRIFDAQSNAARAS